jgi:ribose 5-phosphate isomerase B
MKYLIASDHAAVGMKSELIEHLKTLDLQVEDLGPKSNESVDYSDYANKLCEQLQNEHKDGNDTLGILICGTGIGMSIASNKHKGIRSALCSEPLSARFSKQHNNANILCMGARIIGIELAKDIVNSWINASFEGGRHEGRIKKFCGE